MNTPVLDPRELITIWFWRSVAYGTELAVRNRKLVYSAARYAPVVGAAAAAFILGRLVGAALGVALF